MPLILHDLEQTAELAKGRLRLVSDPRSVQLRKTKTVVGLELLLFLGLADLLQ